ncbi:hypothetical protein HZQ67_15020 [Elizabethkingia anophelis]|nr:hypothetical protein [Elizabethkingia anophelis]
MKLKVLILSIVLLGMAQACIDRNTDDSLEKTSVLQKKSIIQKKEDSINIGKNTTKSHEAEISPRAQQEQEIVDPTKSDRPR